MLVEVAPTAPRRRVLGRCFLRFVRVSIACGANAWADGRIDVESPIARDPRAAISTAVVGLLNDYTGRGPTQAHTTIAADMIVVTLRDCLTRAERTLASRG